MSRKKHPSSRRAESRCAARLERASLSSPCGSPLQSHACPGVSSFESASCWEFSLPAAQVYSIAQQAPASSGARILLLPRRIVSGERATLAVLDVSGRLTPGVTVSFSNGDRLTTDVTGRALFVAPLNTGVVFASIEGRTGRVATAILTPNEAASTSIEISAVPQVASLTDRFEISGRGFCGDADSNQVIVGGQPALILASSPVSLVVLPPMGLKPGTAAVEVSCAKNVAPFSRRRS